MATNFNDTTPAAPSGSVNVKWQSDSSGNASAYVSSSGGGSLPSWLTSLPDAPPATAGSLDDEFLGASFDTVRWTWVNQGSVTVSQAQSILGLFCPRGSGDNKHVIVQTAPATPWEVTAKLWFLAPNSNYALGGLAMRDSAGKLVLFHYQWTGVGLGVTRMNSPTSFDSTVFSFAGAGYLAIPSYFRIRDDGTNLKYSYSPDGSAFMQMYQESRTVFMTSGPTQVGLVLDANQTSFDIQLSCDWFRRTL